MALIQEELVTSCLLRVYADLASSTEAPLFLTEAAGQDKRRFSAPDSTSGQHQPHFVLQPDVLQPSTL